MRAESTDEVKFFELQRYNWFTCIASLMTFSCVRSEYTTVLWFKRKQRCVNVNASYLHAFLVMINFFDEQYFENEWSDFISSNYATDCKNLTLFSFLNYFVSHNLLEFNSRLIIFFKIFQSKTRTQIEFLLQRASIMSIFKTCLKIKISALKQRRRDRNIKKLRNCIKRTLWSQHC